MLGDMWLSDADFVRVYSQIVRVCVDVVLVSDGGVVLERRKMEPDVGRWSVSGGTLYREETLEEAVKRFAIKDWGIEVEVERFLGAVEFLHETETLFDGRHSVGLAFLCRADEGAVADLVASRDDVAVFDELPGNISKQHGELLERALGMKFGESTAEVRVPVEVKGRIPYEEFVWIYERVPRLCVETVVLNEKDEVLLTKRGIDPYKGWWHLPGGSVLKGEALEDAVRRVGREELGVEVEIERMMEPERYVEMPGDAIDQVAVSLPYMVRVASGEVNLNEQGEEWGWFGELPEKTAVEHVGVVGKARKSG